jgi:hypothetical protein
MKTKDKTIQKLSLWKKYRKYIAGVVLALFLLGLFPAWDFYRTISSLVKVDDYPVYQMQYYGGYTGMTLFSHGISKIFQKNQVQSENKITSNRGCTLFCALGDKSNILYGRNFDWSFSPLLVLHTHPPDGYESIGLVDLAYLGFDKTNTAGNSVSFGMALRLLITPLIILEGINECGLTIAIAAVPNRPLQTDPEKKTVHSCYIIRRILDQAKDTEQALAILQTYNPIFEPGPSVHYLISDTTGKSAVVEFLNGKWKIFSNTQTWQAATNFYIADITGNTKPNCTRYNTAMQILKENHGILTAKDAMKILEKVSMSNTKWSVVYHMNHPQLDIALDRDYGNIHKFSLKTLE